MGADGHIVIAKREDFERENPGVKPSDLGLYEGTVLGVEACWGYYGDNLFEPNYGDNVCMNERYIPASESPTGKFQFVPLTDEEKAARQAALKWFDRNSESHEVWT